jgi:hypothetical protein
MDTDLTESISPIGDYWMSGTQVRTMVVDAGPPDIIYGSDLSVMQLVHDLQEDEGSDKVHKRLVYELNGLQDDKGPKKVQKPWCALCVTVIKSESLDPAYQGLLVVLSSNSGQSKVCAGDPLLVCTDQQKWWYLTNVGITIRVSIPGAIKSSSLPHDVDAGGSKSTSTEFDLNAGAGMTGGEPPISAGVGYSHSKTVTTNIRDISIHNYASPETLHQEYRLTSSSNHSYSKPRDLIDQHFLSHTILHDLDDQVTSGGVPILSQGHWAVSQDFKGKFEIEVYVMAEAAGISVSHTLGGVKEIFGEFKGYIFKEKNILDVKKTYTCNWFEQIKEKDITEN